MGLRFVLAAYFAGGILVSAVSLLVGIPPIVAFQIGFWVGGLGAAVLASLSDAGRFPVSEPHDTF